MYDVCIIGSGAGGAPIAYELSRAGKRVLVLEKGRYYTEKDFFKDELAVSRRDIYTPPLDEEQHVIETQNSDGEWEAVESRKSGWNFWNGSMVGGSSNLMSGYFHRMKPNDFKLLSTYGKIEGANIVDWMIDYKELEPYYDKVEKIVGVSGRVVKHPFLEPRSSAEYPFKPTWEHPISSWFDTACQKLGLYSIPTARAVLPSDALERKGCSYSNFCGSYGCATGAKGNARSALLNKALKTGNCTILSDSFVYKIDNDGKKATKIHYYNKNGRSLHAEAKLFVLAAQAVESSRLLLNSKSSRFKNGLLNNYGQVGKNLIFSAGGSGEGRLRFEDLPKEKQNVLLLRGAFVNRSLQDWYEFEQEGKKIKGGTIDFLFEHANPTNRAMGEVYDKDLNLIWGERLQQRIKYAFIRSRKFVFEVFNDWLPTDDCFVGVDENVKDKWGVPVAKIRLNSHNHDIEVGSFLAQKAETLLKEMGAVEIRSNISSAPPPNLVAGGCRFGNNEENSVLDRNCKAHALDNLYVTDASFMPTGGSVPYTWTIYANSFRVADKILKRFHDKEL
ncbi:GMC family oxidoreductase [Sulfurimonas sp. HSL-1716]|uniref:GMC family oxidoreductase n=1 Tax=Hydrocurvibacter sulfurireducens TaxID=3131937 RepID=UPI0031F9DF46